MLVEDLRQALPESWLERRMRVYLALKTLVIDEVEYLPFNAFSGTMLFPSPLAMSGAVSASLPTSALLSGGRCSPTPS